MPRASPISAFALHSSCKEPPQIQSLTLPMPLCRSLFAIRRTCLSKHKNNDNVVGWCLNSTHHNCWGGTCQEPRACSGAHGLLHRRWVLALCPVCGWLRGLFLGLRACIQIKQENRRIFLFLDLLLLGSLHRPARRSISIPHDEGACVEKTKTQHNQERQVVVCRC